MAKEKNLSASGQPRPPIVVVMGHVDHGKTTLLDYIRKTSVAQREAGGITQSIGAYEIIWKNQKITFIDTPGHEAFSKMRGRGAEAADLAILVVAADESVKPQTKEAIRILEETTTPFVVAINKMDKPSANIEKTKQDLLSNNVLLEGLGGSVSFEPISAKTGENVDKLLDLVVLAAQMENLIFNPESPAEGFILEAKRSSRRGVEVSVILKNGVLKSGNFISAPTASGKIMILEDFLGKKVDALEPSAPALIIGFEKLPQVGEKFQSGAELLIAQDKDFENPKTEIKPAARPPMKASDTKLNFILKAEDSGSLEALAEVIKSLPLIKDAKIISSSIGEVSDNDIQLAQSFSAIIVGFKNKISKSATNMAQKFNVRIIASDIIYKLIEAVDELMKSGSKEVKGELQILAVFNQEKPQKQIVGGKVLSGILKNHSRFEIKRNSPAEMGEKTIGEGKILNLQSNKKEVEKIESGECGLLVNSKTLIQVGDKLVTD